MRSNRSRWRICGPENPRDRCETGSSRPMPQHMSGAGNRSASRENRHPRPKESRTDERVATALPSVPWTSLAAWLVTHRCRIRLPTADLARGRGWRIHCASCAGCAALSSPVRLIHELAPRCFGGC